MKYATAAAAIALALGGASAVQAQQLALTVEQVNMRAGPDPSYPMVAVVPPGVYVTVQGCLSDYRWCDVSFGPDRGWVFAANLQYAYENRVVPLPSIGAVGGDRCAGLRAERLLARPLPRPPLVPRPSLLDRPYHGGRASRGTTMPGRSGASARAGGTGDP
jgi:uncharacterized protein YraI